MKKLTFLFICIFALCLATNAQQKEPKKATVKPDSMQIIQIQIDTASLKTVQNLIIENMKGEITTKQVVTNSIFGILFKNAKMVNIPKEPVRQK